MNDIKEPIITTPDMLMLESMPPWVMTTVLIVSSILLFFTSYYSIGIILALMFTHKIEVEIETKDGLKHFQLISSKNPIIYVRTLKCIRKNKKINEKLMKKIIKKCPAIIPNSDKTTKNNGKIEEIDISDI